MKNKYIVYNFKIMNLIHMKDGVKTYLNGWRKKN